MYSNLIPALFFPAQMANNQKPTGGYIAVSMPTSFNQQPFQLLQPLQGHGPSMVYPGSSADSPNLAGINAAKYVSPSSHTRSTPGGTLTEITRGQVELEGGSSPQISLSPELQNSSLSSSIIEETMRDRTRRYAHKFVVVVIRKFNNHHEINTYVEFTRKKTSKSIVFVFLDITKRRRSLLTIELLELVRNLLLFKDLHQQLQLL